jgi:hypothetical protein
VWLGWVAIVLAILGGTPAGFIAFLASRIWILVISVMLTLRERDESASRGPGPAPTTP